MDIKITDQALRKFLDTTATPKELAKIVSLCGPTFDRVNQENDDCVYDIEIITNRIDTASAQGLGRESVAILNQQGLSAKLKNDPYQEKINQFPDLPRTFNFEISDPSFTPRFVAISLENVQVKDSPPETQKLLTLCGERTINNLVDITNELTLLYGMPCHVFDLDKLAPQKLLLRLSQPGETIDTLDGHTNKLQGDDLVFEDGAGRLVDLCGVMGGAVAETDIHTKNIIFIVPVYQPHRIRRTSLFLQKRTLASQIYEKQPDPELCLPVLSQAITLLKERTGATISSSLYDYYPTPPKPKTIFLDLAWLDYFVGISIPLDTIISILGSLGFKTKSSHQHSLECLVPSWRANDIGIKEDLAEEIARVYGYFKIPSKMPCVNLSPEPKDDLLTIESKTRHYLADKGFNEIYNSSLISQDQINASGLDLQKHLKLSNALSKDYEYLRTSLVPSLLLNIKNNQGKSKEPFMLFEISNTYHQTSHKTPDEISNLVIASTQDYRHTKGVLESLFSTLRLHKPKFSTSTDTPNYFVKENTATITANNQSLGYIGPLKVSIQRKLNINSNLNLVEINLPLLTKNISPSLSFTPISEYPEIVESLTLKSDLAIGEIIEKIYSVDPLVKQVEYTNSFGNKHTFNLSFVSQEENLTQNKINHIKGDIINLFS